MKTDNTYNFYKYRKISLFLIIGFSISQILNLADIDILEIITVNLFLKTGLNFKKIMNIIIFIASLYLLVIDKYIWHPFLGDTVLPCSVINKKPPPDANIFVTIQTTPFKKIVYWASMDKENQYVWDAYGDYQNSGTTTADENGKAILKLKKPSGYLLPNGASLSSHVHYRECPSKNDYTKFMGPVQTIYV